MAADTLVGVVVDRGIGAVGLRADARAVRRLTEKVRSDAAGIVTSITYFRRIDQSKPVTPTLTALLRIAQATGVAGPAYLTDRNAVAVLVDDDAVVQVTIPCGTYLVAREHLHPRPPAIRGSGEVRIAGAAPVLSFRLHVVTALAPIIEVIDLEVAASLVEAVLVLHVVDDVVPVEEVGNRGALVAARQPAEVDSEVAAQGAAATRLRSGR